MAITLTITADTPLEFQEQLQHFIKTTSIVEPTVQAQTEEKTEIIKEEVIQDDRALTSEVLPEENEHEVEKDVEEEDVEDIPHEPVQVVQENEQQVITEEFIEKNQTEMIQPEPTTEKQQFNIAQIGVAAKSLMEELPELKEPVMNLLSRYGAKTLKDLDETHYQAIALDLRELGALI